MTYDFVLTFGSTSVSLASVLTSTGIDVPVCNFISLQPDTGNTHVIYVGGLNHGLAVSSSVYGFRLEAPVSTVPPAPWIGEIRAGGWQLGEFFVNGTSGEKLRIFLKV